MTPSYLKAAANNRRLIHSSFGVTITNTLAHTPHPHRRSVLMTQIADRFAPEVNTTAHSPFRSETDVSLMSSLAQHQGLLTGHALNGDLAYAFVNLGAHNLKRKLDDLLTRDRDVLCLGDHHQHALLQARIDEPRFHVLGHLLPARGSLEHSAPTVIS